MSTATENKNMRPQNLFSSGTIIGECGLLPITVELALFEEARFAQLWNGTDPFVRYD